MKCICGNTIEYCQPYLVDGKFETTHIGNADAGQVVGVLYGVECCSGGKFSTIQEAYDFCQNLDNDTDLREVL